MKRAFFSVGALVAVFVIFTAFTNKNVDSKAVAPDFIMKDYVSSIHNAALEARFEQQFAEIVKDVTHIDAHFNKESETYFYTVYGTNEAGKQVVDYFKTTEDEVKSETYNYIEMTDRTMQWPPRRKCREALTYPFPGGNFCHPDNPGYICGIEVRPGVCLYY